MMSDKLSDLVAQEPQSDMEDEGNRRAQTRQRLLDAGSQCVRQDPGAALASLLSAQRVAVAAEHHRDTFYRYWDSSAEFVSAWASHVLGKGSASLAATEPLLAALAATQPSEAEGLVRAAAELNFRASLHDDQLGARLLLLAASTAPLGSAVDATAVRERFRAYYVGLNESVLPAYRAALRAWGRRLVPGFDLKEMAVVLTAVVEGLVQRWLVDPDSVPDHLFGDIVLLLLVGVTEPTEPLVSPGPSFLDREPTRTNARGKRSREALIGVARERFERRGYFTTTVADIAEQAGVSEATVYSHFGSKRGIAAAALAHLMEPLEAGMRRDSEGGLSVPDLIRGHLRRLAETLHRHHGLSGAFMEILIAVTETGPPVDPRDPRSVVPVPRVLVPVLERGKREGRVRTDLDTYELAAMITNAAMVRVFTRPLESPEAVADFVSKVVLDGVCSPEVRAEA